MKFMAVLIAIGFASLSVPAAVAADYKPGVSAKKSKKSVRKYRRAPQVAGYRLRGGYRNGDEFTPYVYQNDYGNYPRFENRSFSERVMDGLRSEP